MDSNQRYQTQELYISNSKKLEQIEKVEMSGHIFRSKRKWTQDGRKIKNVFFKKEPDNIQEILT